MGGTTRRNSLEAPVVSSISLSAQTRRDPLAADIFRLPIIPAPDDSVLWPAFGAALGRWRAEMRKDLNYTDAIYGRKESQWASRAFCSCKIMLWDEAFYSRELRRFARQKVTLRLYQSHLVHNRIAGNAI